MTRFSALLIGHESLTIQCGDMLRAAGHDVVAVVSAENAVMAWAAGEGLTVVAPGKELAGHLEGLSFDWIVSAANLAIIPDDVLAMPGQGSVNFHDGPLPKYAGLNAPVWAILNGEASHGITWHLIEDGVDEGRIVTQEVFDIAADETAFTLNAKCYAAGVESFGRVIEAMAKGAPDLTSQDLTQRSYFARADRPEAGAVLDLRQDASALARLVRALDHGSYPNPLTAPKLALPQGFALIGRAEVVDGKGDVGEALARDADGVTVACGRGALRFSGLLGLEGAEMPAIQPADRLPVLSDAERAEVSEVLRAAAKAEPKWIGRLTSLTPAKLALGGTGSAAQDVPVAPDTTRDMAFAAFAALFMDGDYVDLAAASRAETSLLSAWHPVRISSSDVPTRVSVTLTPDLTPFAADLPYRLADRPDFPIAGLADGPGAVPGASVTLDWNGGSPRLIPDPDRLGAAEMALLADRLDAALAGAAADPNVPVGDLGGLPEIERTRMLIEWNATETDYEDDQTIPAAILAQAAARPDDIAIIFEDQTTTFGSLAERVQALADRLAADGVARGDRVGLCLPRSADLIVAALAIQSVGAAYVPLDPAYPADRLALYIEDSGAKAIVSTTELARGLPEHGAIVVDINGTSAKGALQSEGPVPEDVAYLIYTSGSTGRPKGVMVSHRNVMNFFAGMDARIPHEPGDRLLAVTSLNFDISVLELFWTLSRGMTVVMSDDEDRTLVSSGQGAPVGGMDFSLFYWGNDDGVGRDKYRLLLDGAKFADAHGFTAVWTPERHFHAFGGPYPNPSVTGAAVAGVTQNLAVRAGSCVGPLHHPARIAEEWAVIDNLTDGRAGLAIASGWQPDDFVLRPENTPPANKPAMFDTIETLRKLWKGEPVAFPTAEGEPHEVVTQPRPVSKDLPIWVTTAGNPETWREAGRIGAHVLTHLLGQSVEEVGEKIGIYHAALREAGYDPKNFGVTLMLHSFLADSRDEARVIAREPMKDYLRSAAGLIKQYAWAFPAFKKPQGVDNAFQLDLGSLDADEMEAILDFAFERYFNDSGLFGTVEDAMARVAEVKAIGVTEIACLIDYGIDVDTVLEGLRPLAEVVAQANADTQPAADDFSIAAQIRRHDVSHLQCTPSMARMLVTDDGSRAALSGLRHLMVGGEALPGALVADLAEATDARIENMYGPTETTIWSTTRTVRPGDGIASIGTPIANTQTYVLDDAMQPVPVGVAGELWIGGDGVALGYWQRPDLTAERFRDDPFRPGGRIYGTGDLVRWAADGTLDFLGRADHQVKLRGHRIELGEIEAVLDAMDGVRQSVVVARDDRLIAYVTGAGADEATLKAAAADVLPPHMVPARVVMLDAFPLTPNKKVDRKALPAPEAVTRRTAPAIAPPTETSVQTAESREEGAVLDAISAIWAQILGVPRPGPRDNFFDLGGHSLLAVQAHREIKSALSATRLGITDIFRHPTLGALAAHVEGLSGPSAAPKAVATKPVDPGATETAQRQVTIRPGDRATERAAARSDAMARRREMRARRRIGS